MSISLHRRGTFLKPISKYMYKKGEDYSYTEGKNDRLGELINISELLKEIIKGGIEEVLKDQYPLQEELTSQILSRLEKIIYINKNPKDDAKDGEVEIISHIKLR